MPFRLNAVRGVIQVFNCKGAVVAQFRLSPEALARLAASQKRAAHAAVL